VGKKRVYVNKGKMNRLHGGDDEWQRVNRNFKTEIEPIVKTIKNPRLTARVREPLGNYLVIRLVSMTDYYFSNRLSRMIDEGKLDASKVMDKQSLDEEVNKGKYTAGALVATNFNYSNYDDIQKILSKLLGLNFLSTVRELDRTHPYEYVEGGISLDNNWDDFRVMFDLRDDIAHEIRTRNCLRHNSFPLQIIL
jgi:hypothetical protein